MVTNASSCHQKRVIMKYSSIKIMTKKDCLELCNFFGIHFRINKE